MLTSQTNYVNQICFKSIDTLVSSKNKIVTGSITYPVGKTPLFIYIFTNNSVQYVPGVTGKSVNKQRIVCDKIAGSRYSCRIITQGHGQKNIMLVKFSCKQNPIAFLSICFNFSDNVFHV